MTAAGSLLPSRMSQFYLHQAIFAALLGVDVERFVPRGGAPGNEGRAHFLTVNHMDGNKRNNSMDNLQAVSLQENAALAKRGWTPPHAGKTRDLRTVTDWLAELGLERDDLRWAVDPDSGIVSDCVLMARSGHVLRCNAQLKDKSEGQKIWWMWDARSHYDPRPNMSFPNTGRKGYNPYHHQVMNRTFNYEQVRAAESG